MLNILTWAKFARQMRRARYVPFVVRRSVVSRLPFLPKLRPDRLWAALRAARSPNDHVFVDWNPRDRNWGDALNPYLVGQLSGKLVLSSRCVFVPRGCDRYAVLGSVLGMNRLDGATVWGAGFIEEGATAKGVPARVLAVRGPRSASKLGCGTDTVFGDPAVLMPRIYMPTVDVQYRLGIVPHYADASHAVLDVFRAELGVRVIDIEGSIEEFVDQLLSCKVIASSSLHGLIAADAYGIPRTWLRLSDHVTGGSFKFLDYAEGAQLAGHPTSPYEGPLVVEAIIAAARRYPIDDQVERELLRACPWS